jgi:hypothetical protein
MTCHKHKGSPLTTAKICGNMSGNYNVKHALYETVLKQLTANYLSHCLYQQIMQHCLRPSLLLASHY